MKTKGDQQLLKRINRSVLLRLLRDQPGQSRARLAQASGLTKSTVSALVRELLDEHWIAEADAPVASDGMGRPSTPLHIDGQRRVLMGVEIGVRQMRLVTVSLTGVVLSSAEQALDSADAQAVCKQMAQMVHPAWRDLGQRGLLLSGIGVCLPGAIDETSDLVRFAPNLGWRDLPFHGMVHRALARSGVPVVDIHLQNDGDAAALGEYEFATTGDAGPLIFISCDVGVGAGVVLNDHLFSGARGMAGEIGHSIMQVDGELCSCGRRGCAETFIGARALGTQAGIERAARYLGVLIQNLDVMFNPRVVVVGGQSCSDRPELLQTAITVVAQYAANAGAPPPQVRGARYGLLAAAVGAAAVAWHHYLRPVRSGSLPGEGNAGRLPRLRPVDVPAPLQHRTPMESV
ncbi:MAG: ROK family transcriptional regulator [Rhodoferax sp.]|nr:ROK family transcriptional regulator [Rhodoferax sp.]MBP9931364.1 ROK family transcriptional regulator [Rhodoferax sp.]HQX59629.1 ROK family transcriptional regulator [Burkholderiaceae bacterium]HQZ07252.1 ROK family transcriptional regulator [Burkholderiaceae bacterium]